MDATVIVHATVLVKADGARLLIDPLFGLAGRYAGMVEPALQAPDVADVDAMLLTHAHGDHLDPGFLELIGPQTAVVVPARMEWPEGVPPPQQTEQMAVWETLPFGEAEVTCVPAVHRGTSCGYVIEAGGRVLYVAGDTHYTDDMVEIGRRWAIDLALLPEAPRPEIPVMDAEEAAAAVRALHPAKVALYHLGRWMKTEEQADAADDYLRTLQYEAPETEVLVARDGEAIAV